MASELRKAALEADDLSTEIVTVPQWKDIKIEIRSLTAGERARLVSTAMRDSVVDMEKYTAELIIASAYDPETGEKVFERADRDAINKKNAAAIDLLFTAATRLSGLSGNAIEGAKATFETAQSADSPSS